jgi:hypothetical protein
MIPDFPPKYQWALEAASNDLNIKPFTEFVAERVAWSMKQDSGDARS